VGEFGGDEGEEGEQEGTGGGTSYLIRVEKKEKLLLQKGVAA